MAQPAIMEFDISGPLAFGPLFWGYTVANILYGISILQGYIYFETRRNGAGQKLFVALMLFIDTLSVIFTAIGMSTYLMTHFGNPEQLLFLNWPLIAHAFLVAVTPVLINPFLAYRVYQFGQAVPELSTALTTSAIAITVLSCAVVGLALEQAAEALHNRAFSHFTTHKSQVVLGTSLSLGALAAILVAGSLVAAMRRSRTSFSKTNDIIRSLIIYVINRGILSVAVRVGWLVSFFAKPPNAVWTAFLLLMVRVDVNTLLAVLNSQHLLDPKRTDRITSSRGTRSDRSGTVDIKFRTDTYTDHSGPSEADAYALTSISTAPHTGGYPSKPNYGV